MESNTPTTGPGGTRAGHMVYIIHEVADFDQWKTHFDDHEPVRQNFGLNLVSLMRDLDNDNRVHIAFSAQDLGRARAFADSPDLKEKMQQAGVMGKPEMYFLNLKAANLGSTDTPYRLIVMHRVKDYDQWKKHFDDHKTRRQEYQLQDRVVSREDGDANNIGLSFAAGTLEKAREFMGLDDLKEVMQEAGVEGPPNIYFAKVVG